MGRTHINLLSTQKNVLADCVWFGAGCVWLCVRACLRVSLLFIPPPQPACHLEAGQSRKKKSKHHLYVKAHLSRGGGEKKKKKLCRGMQPAEEWASGNALNNVQVLIEILLSVEMFFESKEGGEGGWLPGFSRISVQFFIARIYSTDMGSVRWYQRAARLNEPKVTRHWRIPLNISGRRTW